MASKRNTSNATTFARRIWSNVLREQYLHCVTDEQMSTLLGVTHRTLANYKRDPSGVTVKQLQAILEGFGLDPEALIKS